METHHIYTAKRYVISTITTKLQELVDWKYFDILVFKTKNSKEANKPESFEELVKLLEKYDKVYSFNEVATNLHGAIAYDIILEGEE